MEMIKLENVEKDYGNKKIMVRALKEINVNIPQGDFAVFAGPSGSGKTTLLNIVGAMDNVTNGKIFVAGKDITNLSIKEASDFRRDKIGFIFQSYNLIPVLTAYENVEFSLDLLGKFTKSEKKDKIEKILEEVGIQELRNRRPNEMSGGQQQRVAIARALVKKPMLILADEPTANLDSVTGEKILKLMRRLNEEEKVTFLFSSHDQLIIDYAKKIFWLRDGKIRKEEKK